MTPGSHSTLDSNAPEPSHSNEKPLFELLDNWLETLPTQLIRDWLLICCSVFVLLNLAQDRLLASEGHEGHSFAAQERGSQSEGWSLVPARLNPKTLEKPASAIDPVTPRAPLARRSTTIGGAIQREQAVLEPTEFQGFSEIPGEHWVVQLAAFDSLEPLKAMVQRHQLSGAIGATLLNEGKEMHVLLLNVFPTKEQALLAGQNLPAGLEQINPWIRSVNSIRTRLK